MQPKLNHSVSQERELIKEKQVKHYNEKAKDIPPLTPGQPVMIEPDYKGRLLLKVTVVGSINQRPSSYEVETESGPILRRNIKSLV